MTDEQLAELQHLFGKTEEAVEYDPFEADTLAEWNADYLDA